MRAFRTAQVAILVVAAIPAAPAEDAPAPLPMTGPRVLILSLDGVGYDTVETVRARGAFEGWPDTRPLVSTFPSMTNIAFAAAYEPFGMAAIAGYEVRHYDYEQNRIIGGGPVGYKKHAFAWRQFYDVMKRTTMEKTSYYTRPRKSSQSLLDETERVLFENPDKRLVVAHIGATDVTAHIKGAEELESLLGEIAERVEDLPSRHLERFGQPLTVVLLSDHGNTARKVHFEPGFKESLRDAGFRVVKKLKRPGDVVAPTFGVVSYGVLFTDPDRAREAALAVTAHPVVDLAAYLTGGNGMRVVSEEGEAEVRWREALDGERSFSYSPLEKDPLLLNDVVEALRDSGRMRSDGFATGDAWLAASVFDEYPDAPRRLADSLTGRFVTNAATVVFSIKEGYSWGLVTARMGAVLLGGRLEGTHGGLDRTSSLGFFLTNDPDRRDKFALAIDEALDPWRDLYEALQSENPDAVAELSDSVEPCRLLATGHVGPEHEVPQR